MLKKLIKYDIDFVNKFLIPFSIITILITILCRICFEFLEVSFIFKILYYTTVIVANGLIINLVINIIIRNILRFNQQLYGDESYLVHTLPVKRNQIVASKIISSSITTITSFLVAIGCLFIEYSAQLGDIIKQLLGILKTNYNMSEAFTITIIIIYIFAMITWLLEMCYTASELGHRHNENKTALSFVYAITLYIITQVINLIALVVIALFNNNLLDILKTNNITPEALKPLLILVIGLNITYVIAYYLLATKLINKKLNVD